jgi:predicted TIM-barrel fold metal-dependent hydrolase
MIDTHIHAVDSRLPGGKPLGPQEIDLGGRPDAVAVKLIEAMKAAGVTHALAMGRVGGPADDPLGINGTLRLAAMVPGLRAVGSTDPTRIPAAHPEHFRRAEADVAEGKVVALKAYLGYFHYGPDSPSYRTYIRLASRYKIPFIFHTGDTWSTTAKVRFAHPLLVDDVAVDFPDVKFVLSHFGYPWLMDAAEVVYKNENVWADVSGLIVGGPAAFPTDAEGNPAPGSLAASVLPDLRKAFAYAEKPHRFLFASDWPMAPMASYRAFVASFIPKEHHAAVFETNARALFGIR